MLIIHWPWNDVYTRATRVMCLLKEAAMQVVDKEAPMDRVSRIRRHLEDGWEPDLFSDEFVNKSPWHRQRFQPDSLFSDWRINVEDAIEE
ncbi:MAG TPA: hypothetical protein VEX13_16345, partial [Chloroflexia bacterium]|nr:hypothetical protein [Chloroflexia bacterium]